MAAPKFWRGCIFSASKLFLETREQEKVTGVSSGE